MEAWFRRLRGDDGEAPCRALRERLAEPRRAYHDERHVLAVLGRTEQWTNGEPDVVLIAAALYHDAVYDPTRGDNELQSMQVCFDALTAAMGFPARVALEAADLIWATAFHEPRTGRTDEILLLDADLWVLGSEPQEYDRYVGAVRREYDHVDEAAWRTGRAAILTRFLDRPTIYHGPRERVGEREAQARRNIAAEIEHLQK